MKWMKSFLEERTQMVSVSGKMSSPQHMNLGTPQGSRMSPILFLCLMADMDLWAEDSIISNFADDTQSIIIRNKKEESIEATQKEAHIPIDSIVSEQISCKNKYKMACNPFLRNRNHRLILLMQFNWP